MVTRLLAPLLVLLCLWFWHPFQVAGRADPAAAVPTKPVPSSPADAEKQRQQAQREAYEATAELIDKLFLDGKVAEYSKITSDPATYNKYTALAYSMNPVDFFYFATWDYWKELGYSSLMTVAQKTATLTSPVVGFELSINLEMLDRYVRMEEGKDPSKLTPDLRTKFTDAFKTMVGLEGKAGEVFDFVFVNRTANDAIGEIHKLSKAFQDSGAELDRLARDLRAAEQTKKLALEKHAAGTRQEITRIRQLVTPDATPQRRQELEAQLSNLETNAALLDRQALLAGSRVALAERMERQAQVQRETAVRLNRIADGVKDNLPLLGKLANYLQKNKEGLPLDDVDDMIDICLELSKRERDWKGELEDLYQIYNTKGLSELLHMATEHAMAMGGEAYEGLADRVAPFTRLQTLLDPIKVQLDRLSALSDLGVQVQATYMQVAYWGDTRTDMLKRTADVVTGQGSTDDYHTVRDAAKRAVEWLDKRDKAQKKLEKAQETLKSLQELGLPSVNELAGKNPFLKEIQDEIEASEKEKKEAIKQLEENSDVLKAWKWVEEKQKKLTELKKKHKTAIELMTKVVDHLDKDMPEIDLAPDQEYKDVLLGWFGGKGATYTGFARVTDANSGINPERIHLFYFDVQNNTNHEIKDIKLIPVPGGTVQRQILAPQIRDARVRYRFQPPGPGDYVIWGYVRDRAGHASCALANARWGQSKDHQKWAYKPEGPEDRQVLEFLRAMMEAAGCNPDEVFRRRDFNEVRLKLKADETAAKIVIHEPYNLTNEGLDPSKPLRFNFEVEDPESWFSTDDVTVWITDEFGRPVWESQERAKWQITPTVKPEDKLRTGKTGMVPKATFDVPGVRAEGPGIYYACVQVMNGAQVVGGGRQMFFLGQVKPWTLVSDVRPPVAQQGAEVRISHTFWNIKDAPIESVTLQLKQTPAALTVVQADEARSVRSIATGGREKLDTEHVFKVGAKPEQSGPVELVYECTLRYQLGQSPRKVAIPVPVTLYDVDAETACFVRGSLHYKYQNDMRPVPFGTMLSISQVYKMPAMGDPKWVEQYVGYGEVANDAGDYFMKISPIGKPPYRMRLVAKSQAREKDLLKGRFVGTAGVFGLETSRPLTCITPTFDVSTAVGTAFKGQVYELGTQVIPYYSAYMRDKSRRIPIPWEGELSTGGYISPYGHGFAEAPMLMPMWGSFAGGDGGGLGTFLQNPAVSPEIGKSAAGHAAEAVVEGVQPGVNAMETPVSFLNFNGSLSILDTLVKGHRFSKQLRYLAKDGSAYESAVIPLAFDKGRVVVGPLPTTAPTTVPTTGPATQGAGGPELVCGVPFMPNPDFTYRKELVRESHIKETFYEAHEYVYRSSRPPPVQEYLERSRQVTETRYTTKQVKVRTFVIADTGNNRVVELEPSTNTTSVALSDVKEPVSAEKLGELLYLVCARGEDKVAIYRSGSPIWSCPKLGEAKPDQETVLKRPEFATMTGGGTVVICDAGNHRVLEVDVAHNRVLWSYDQLSHPVMAQLTSAGTYLITDRGAHQVLEIDAEKKVIWSFGTHGKAGAGNLLNQPQSAIRSGGMTIIADAGNRRVIQVGRDGQVKRSIGPIQEMRSDPQTGKIEPVSIPLDSLTFAARFSGIDYLINGDVILSVDPKDRVTGRHGGPERLAKPEHFTTASLKVPVKVAEEVTRDEPYYLWKQTVEIIKRPKTTVYLEDLPRGGVKLDPSYLEEPPIVGATANWAPGHLLAREHGLRTAGLAENQQRLRIYVNGGNDNSDDSDPHVIARAYGNLLRNRLIRRSLTAHDYDQRNRTSPRDAWERGWDTFLACAVLENPRFMDRTFLGQEIPAHTFNLEKTYQEMLERYRSEPETLDRDFPVFRGIDSPFAHAMLLYQLYRTYGSVVVSHAITFARGGVDTPTGRYIDPATLLALYPDSREVFEVLGMVPRLLLKFPDQGVQTLDTAYPRLEWDVNGLVGDPDGLDYTLVLAEDHPSNVVRRIPGIQGQVMDFGQILKPEDAAAKLAEQFEGRKIYFWRIEIAIEDGPIRYTCTSPWGAFQIEVTTHVIRRTGGTINLEAAASPLRQFGKLIVPDGALDDDASISAQHVELARDQGDFEAIHGKAFDLRAEGIRFRKPATIEFQFNETDLAGRDPRGLGVYRFNPRTKQWDYLGSKVGEGLVSAQTEHNSIYALLYDKRGPQFLDAADSPDHAFRKDTLSIRFRLRKPTVTTLKISDATGKPVRTLCEDQLLSGVEQEYQLPLSDLPEGRYTYTISGTDQAGVKAEPVDRAFLVSDAVRGSVQGRIDPEVTTPGAAVSSLPLRVYIPDTSIEFRSGNAEGTFLLTGIVPGRYELQIERPGLFSERAVVEVHAGETTDIGSIRMSDRVLKEAKLTPEIFTPNNDGDRDFAALELRVERACTVRVIATDAAGKAVAIITDRRELPAGDSTVLWRGTDDRGRPLRSGWYTLEVSADALGVWVPAAKVQVLLDRGLVRDCLPLPRVFSPNGDGFEDELQVSYQLEGEALVTLEVHDAQGRLLAVPARGVRQAPGPNAVTWDGTSGDGGIIPDGRYYYRVLPQYVTSQSSLAVGGEFLVDSTAPEILELTPANGHKLNDGRPEIRARMAVASAGDLDGGALRIKIDEHTVTPDSFDPRSGVFTFRPRTSLGEGLHIAVAYARDLAGNDAPPRAVSFMIERSTQEVKYHDREPPTLTLHTPAQNSTVYTGTPLISATLADDGSGIDDKNIVVHLDGERVCNNVKMFLPGKSGKSWDWYYYEKAIILYDPLMGEMRFVPGAGLTAGKHQVRIEVMDRHGNVAKAAEGTFTVVLDNQPPMISDLTPADGSLSAGPVERITAKIVDQGASGLDVASLRLLVDGQEMPSDLASMYDSDKGLLTYTFASPLEHGRQHVIVLTARDRAANPSEARVNVVTLVQDTTPPRIDVYTPKPGQRLPAGPPARLIAAVYDLGPAELDESSLRILVNGKPIPQHQAGGEQGEAPVLRDGILDLPLPSLAPGSHLLTLFVRDRAGNGAREAAVPFTIAAPQEDSP